MAGDIFPSFPPHDRHNRNGTPQFYNKDAVPFAKETDPVNECYKTFHDLLLTGRIEIISGNE